MGERASDRGDQDNKRVVGWREINHNDYFFDARNFLLKIRFRSAVVPLSGTIGTLSVPRCAASKK